ncbi:conserved hypothetical protein [Leishmania mexicana MHOM/GT/2001/U1103]|uniref:TRAF3-interacting protein 1 n=1 Tax=Leishmania mexicana (strain MHOM/GT/2001/U1103) TaxID=929439 RepID=E9B2S2_LEIMU|nr:conserved hypothetical protein [Leishmania mexicana MHOM/GT/2001/U1103]CBZ29535.1 conserved hypothetical protein [Leishmania mexicana MHOM/GT/2001/U1103]
MNGEVDFWSATIAAYQPLQLTSPELTPKLLKRPPFRFIHDIVCGIDARFAAYDHIIPAELRDSAKVDTKEKKIEYLTTLIQYINKIMKVEIDVNPKKIVSGSEPEKTNIFLQYLAAGVGYAQQEKAAQAASAPQQKSATSLASSPSQVAASFSTNPTQGNLSLPPASSLCRKQSSSMDPAQRRKSHLAVLDEAAKFNGKLSGYSLNLNLDEQRDVRTEGQSIVRMWEELANPQTETKPSHLPQEALETAIKRQIETVKMVQELLRENDGVIDKLESLVI